MGKLVGLLGTGVGLVVELSKSKAPPPPGHQPQDACIESPRPSSVDSPRTLQKAPRPLSSVDHHGRGFNHDESSEYRESSLRESSLQSATYRQSSEYDIGNSYNNIPSARKSHDDKRQHKMEAEFSGQNFETNYPSDPPSYQVATHSQNFSEKSRSSPLKEQDEFHHFPEQKSASRSGFGSNTSRDHQILFESRGGLELPIIVPQRRPEDKSRGWMLCYAPMLRSCSVSQQEFLQFLTSFNESSKSSPYLDVVNVAAMGVGFVPGLAPLVVSMVVPMAVRQAKALQTNSQTSKYLAHANQEFFAPHNLFAMVVTFQPQSSSPVLSVNMSSSTNTFRQSAAGHMNPLGGSNSEGDSSFANHAAEMPTAAPLVFPSVEELPTQYKNKFQRTCFIAGDYFDRRARASYATEHPEAQMVLGPKEESNPSSYSGGLKGLIGGGLMQSDGRDHNRRHHEEKRDKRHHNHNGRRRSESSESDDNDHRDNRDDNTGGLIGGLKSKLMKKDLLYLMIVNLPAGE